MQTNYDKGIQEMPEVIISDMAVLIDECDMHWVTDYRCRIDTGYVRIHIPGKGAQPLHRLILQVPDGDFVDHINFNKLDNRRCNLRKCTFAQNMWNRPKTKRNTSGYIGVFKERSTFKARIKVNRKTIYLGAYVTPILAAFAYDRAAHTLRGEFAVTNFPVVGLCPDTQLVARLAPAPSIPLPTPADAGGNGDGRVVPQTVVGVGKNRNRKQSKPKNR